MECGDGKPLFFSKKSKKSKKIKTFFQKPIAFLKKMWYNNQVARTWPLSQAAKTSPSHGEGMGSIPVGVTKKENAPQTRGVFFFGDPSRTHTAPHGGGIWVRILRARRWELAHKSREQKSSPQAKFP